MREFSRLVQLVDTLRGEGGCPWDREQTRETLKPMLVEEAFEVLEAMDDPRKLREELGDLLFQIVFHARIASEKGEFGMADVISGVIEKMVRRHPHVFGSQPAATSAEVLKTWEQIKRTERDEAGEARSVLDGIPQSMPALYQGLQLGARAARVGFDWPDLESIGRKMHEEVAELLEAVRSGDAGRPAEEIGDILFVAVNLARRCGVDPETALSGSNRKFTSRFRRVEASLAGDGLSAAEAGTEELERRWQEVKRREADRARPEV